MQPNKNSTFIEKEFKNLIFKNEYRRTLSYLRLNPLLAVTQSNSFFDNQQFDLNLRNMTLRIRFSNGIRELTLKEDFYDDRKETNYSPVSDKEFADLIVEGIIPKSDISERFERIGIKGPYWYQGEMLTNRVEIPYKGCKLAIDHTQYFDQEDYEIECEKNDEMVKHKKIAKELLLKMNIPRRKTCGKRKRFFEAKLNNWHI